MSFLFALLSLVSSAQATTFYEQPFPDSVKESPVIIHGKVGNTYTDWGHGQDTNKRIYTFWELQVDEVFKGDAPGKGNLILIREMGGDKDGLSMQISGTAHFNRGEDVVVFVSEKNSEGSFDIWGMMMGKYTLQRDSSGQEVLIGAGINTLTHGQIRDEDGSQADTRRTSKWTLESLRRLVASQGGTPGPQAIPGGKPPVTPGMKPQNNPDLNPTPAASLAAPLLQSPPSEASSFPLGQVGLAVGMAILGLVVVLGVNRRK